MASCTGNPVYLGSAACVSGTNIGILKDYIISVDTTYTYDMSWTSGYVTTNTTGSTYINLMDCIQTKEDINSILNMPLEDLPLHLNNKYSETAKKVLDLRLKANI